MAISVHRLADLMGIGVAQRHDADRAAGGLPRAIECADELRDLVNERFGTDDHEAIAAGLAANLDALASDVRQ